MSENSLFYKEVSVGDELPVLPIDLTSSLIVAGAVASRDYTPVHHDKEAAKAAGMQDIFMNILTTNTLPAGGGLRRCRRH
jgi:acyl dehydratase